MNVDSIIKGIATVWAPFVSKPLLNQKKNTDKTLISTCFSNSLSFPHFSTAW